MRKPKISLQMVPFPGALRLGELEHELHRNLANARALVDAALRGLEDQVEQALARLTEEQGAPLV